MRCFLLLPALLFSLAAVGGAQPNAENQPSEVERLLIQQRADALGERIEALRRAGADGDLLADVEIYHKAVVWLLGDPEEFHRKIYSHDALLVAAAGIERAEALAKGEHPWTSERGLVARAYRSRVDGSVQPYLVGVPVDYDPSRPLRLDLILHGRNARLNEVNFLATAERSVGDGPSDRLEMQVFGRTNNAYRWSGETDVFEALAATRRNYRVDDRRIVLRGFSMGGAGAWGVGLHYPDKWVGIEAGAGFTETLRYAEKTLPKPLPAWQRPAMHIYDAADYAVNAYNTAVVGYGGEDDAQLQAAVNIREALADDGVIFRQQELNWLPSGEPELEAIFLVGPKMGHSFHPESKAQSERFLTRAAERGLDPNPDSLRFVTYTTRYANCFWATVDGLEKLYERAEVRARRVDGVLEATTENISRLFLARSGEASSIVVDGQKVAVPAQRGDVAYLAKGGGQWKYFDSAEAARGDGLVKRPGLQGPIDDAFMEGFFVSGPTGDARMEKFSAEYHKWLRADLPTQARSASNHRVLFGDPSSNPEIAAIVDRLPLEWTSNEIRMGGKTYDAKTHYPALIYPDPENSSRYVVINSGHSFHEPEFRGTNALLYPRLGDWAVVRTSDGQAVAAGYFDSQWK